MRLFKGHDIHQVFCFTEIISKTSLRTILR
jgi:hypothetical protein